MVIVEKNKENKIRFDEIDVGDVFKDIHGEYFVKTSSIIEGSDNAIHLISGECEYFDDFEVFEIVNNAKVVIGD